MFPLVPSSQAEAGQVFLCWVGLWGYSPSVVCNLWFSAASPTWPHPGKVSRQTGTVRMEHLQSPNAGWSGLPMGAPGCGCVILRSALTLHQAPGPLFLCLPHLCTHPLFWEQAPPSPGIPNKTVEARWTLRLGYLLSQMRYFQNSKCQVLICISYSTYLIGGLMLRLNKVFKDTLPVLF